MSIHDNQILRLAIPSIISNVTVPLLGLVDLTIVGHIGDATYISAIATGSMIFNVIYWIFGFLRMGTSGMTAQAYGRESGSEATDILRLSVGTGVGIGLLFVILQELILRFMIWAMNTPVDAAPFVTQYFDIVIWGAPAMLSLYAMNGWYIGMQDTRTPMFIAIIQNVINIIASLFFVFVVGWKIEGVATGTLIAQWSGALVAFAGVVYKRRHDKIFTVNSPHHPIIPSSNHPLILSSHHPIKHFLTVNRDIFLRTLCLVAVNMFFTSAGGKQGSMILAVNALLITLYTLFSYFMDGFAYAGEALCGKTYGAGDKAGFWKLVKSLNLWGVAMVVVFTLLYIVGGRGFLSLLTDDTAVVNAAMDYLPWAIAVPACGVLAFIYDGIFVGITATKGMLLSTATAAASFFIIYFALVGSLANTALWIAFLVFLAVRGIVEVALIRRFV